MNIEQITEAAVKLEITLTNAEVGTDLCQCWADRVQAAWYAWQDGDLDRCRESIDAANAYAI